MTKPPIAQLINKRSFILFEGAIVEQLRRHPDVALHSTLANAPLIYDEAHKKVMGGFIMEYISLAFKYNIPLMLTTPTWRANRERVLHHDSFLNVNQDAVSYVKQLSAQHSHQHLYIGGLIGCKNDCYLPEEGLTTKEAESFHQWQIEKLTIREPDYLIAQTLPYLPEARGIAKAMSDTSLPYIISFVINRQGHLLDGTSLDVAISSIDDGVVRPPLGYMINCAYPTFLLEECISPLVTERLIGYVGNASSLDQCDLEGASEIHSEGVEKWADDMLHLHRNYSIRCLGGCCGTSPSYLSQMVSSLL